MIMINQFCVKQHDCVCFVLFPPLSVIDPMIIWLTEQWTIEHTKPSLPNKIYEAKSTKPNQIEPLKPNVNSELLI